MTERLRLVKLEAPPEADGFAVTETARDILRSLDIIRMMSGSRMTMIAGAPGVGKTTAIGHFLAETPEAELLTAVRGEGGIYPLADMILSLWGDGTSNRSRTDVRRQIVSYLAGRGQIIVADEAQHLTTDDLEWLRGVCEETGCDLALVGDLALERTVRAIPQLWSRIARPVVLRAAGRDDAAELARDAGGADPASLRALRAVAGLAGGLGNVRAVLDLAALFAGEGPVEAGHVRAAVHDMKLTTKGTQT